MACGPGWRPARWRRSTPTTWPRPGRWRPDAMPETFLVLNAGSSSIKFQLFEIGPGDALERRFRGQIEGIGTAHPRLAAKDAEGRPAVDREVPPQAAADVGRAQEVLGGWLVEHLGSPP